jgi:hypothetical protein
VALGAAVVLLGAATVAVLGHDFGGPNVGVTAAPTITDLRVDATSVWLTWIDPTNGRAIFVVSEVTAQGTVPVREVAAGTTTTQIVGLNAATAQYCFRVLAIQDAVSAVSAPRCTTSASGSGSTADPGPSSPTGVGPSSTGGAGSGSGPGPGSGPGSGSSPGSQATQPGHSSGGPAPVVVSAALTISVTRHSITANAGGSHVSGGGSIASYTFDFGDGTRTGPQSGATASHTYASVRSYTVTVTVTAGTGATGSTQATATTQAIPPTGSLLLDSMPSSPTTLKADVTHSAAGDFPIKSYTIDWGNGYAATSTWSASGDVTYEVFPACSITTVTLWVTDTAGNQSDPVSEQFFVPNSIPSPCP